MFYAYILENEVGWRYIGSCSNIEARVKRHNQNSVRSTKNRGSFRLVLKEEFNTRTEARKRENQLKKYKNADYIGRLIRNHSTLSSSLV